MQVVVEISHDIFRKKVADQANLLRASCKQWQEEIKNPNLPEDVVGEINVASGQSELLIHERFSQFSNLIDDSEFERSEKEVTLQDLQGFWDIIFFQVESIQNTFNKLNKIKANNWISSATKFPDKPSMLTSLKRKPLTTLNKVKKSNSVPAGRSNIREHILAQRKKMKMEGKKERKLDEQVTVSYEKEGKENRTPEGLSTKSRSNRPLRRGMAEPEDMKRFDAGFFEVHTPVRNCTSRKKTYDTVPQVTAPAKLLASSGLKTRVMNSPVRHKDYSPCMRITRSMKKNQSVKQGPHCTP